MSTIGHPLSDLCNLLQPYTTATNEKAQALKSGTGSGQARDEFIPERTPGLPTKEQCMAWYAEVAGFDLQPEIVWGDAFTLFKGAIIMQGIAARYAVRQASSAKAKDYADMMEPFSYVAWDLVEQAMQIAKSQSKL